MPAVYVISLLGVIGAGLLIAGIYLLVNLGAALVMAGLLFFAAAWFLRSGLTSSAA
jgi:hypothetical protein